MKLSFLEKSGINIVAIAVPETRSGTPWHPREVFTPEMLKLVIDDKARMLSNSDAKSQMILFSHLITLFPEQRVELVMPTTYIEDIFNFFYPDFMRKPNVGNKALDLNALLGSVKSLYPSTINALFVSHPQVKEIMKASILKHYKGDFTEQCYKVAAQYSLATGELFPIALLNDPNERLVPLAEMFKMSTTWWKDATSFVTTNWAVPVRLFLPNTGPLINNPREIGEHMMDQLNRTGNKDAYSIRAEVAHNLAVLSAERVELTDHGLELILTNTGESGESEVPPVPTRRSFE